VAAIHAASRAHGQILFFRPPVRSNGRSYKMLVMFFLFFIRRQISELPRPIAAKLCHTIGTCVHFINWLQKFRELSPLKNWGPKTCKISVDFIQPPTLIANISGTPQDIQHLKTNSSTAIPPALRVKGPVNFGPLITKTDVSTDPLNRTFLGYYISALRGCCALKFLHALSRATHWPSLASAHRNWEGGPPKKI